MDKLEHNNYNNLVERIGDLLSQGKQKTFQKVNTILVETYWHIGQQIIEFEQEGAEKAEYGSKLLKLLSRDLKTKYGKGFSMSNLYVMRQFYLKLPIFHTVSGKLSWSHYAELLGVSDKLAFSFYLKQTKLENWSGS